MKASSKRTNVKIIKLFGMHRLYFILIIIQILFICKVLQINYEIIDTKIVTKSNILLVNPTKKHIEILATLEKTTISLILEATIIRRAIN